MMFALALSYIALRRVLADLLLNTAQRLIATNLRMLEAIRKERSK